MSSQYSNCYKTLKFQSNYVYTTPIFGKVFLELVEKINNFVPCLKLLAKGPNGYVPVLEAENAIKKGILDCAFTPLSYSFVQKNNLEV